MAIHTPPASLIRFIGKAGFVSRELWQDFFHSNRKPEWNRKAWKDLIHRGYCKLHPESRIQNVLVLNRNNRLVRDLIQGLAVSVQRGTHLAHDEILYRGILLAERSGSIGEWHSEAELKSSGKGSFRIESSDGRTKYPDALVYPYKMAALNPIAIECEITQKSAKRYGQIMAAYAGFKDLSAVVFITDSVATMRAVKRAMNENFYPEKSRPIFFVTTEDWKKDSKNVLERFSRNRPEAGSRTEHPKLT